MNKLIIILAIGGGLALAEKLIKMLTGKSMGSTIANKLKLIK
jgi:hypothetical protein